MSETKASNKRVYEEVIILSSDDDDGNDDFTNKRVKETPISAKSDEVCFICGVQFQHTKVNAFQLRIQHIKRCAKRFGVSARDLTSRHEDLDTGYECTTTEDESESIEGSPNIQESLLTSKDPSHLQKTTAVHTEKLSASMNSAPSINNVLMAGARTLAKTCAILSKSQEKVKSAVKFTKFRSLIKTNPSTNVPSHKRITATDIICDGFQYASKALSSTYFLSHFHSDHYTGITKDWNVGLIYCSPITATLVHSQLGVDAQYLRPLPMNERTILESKGKPISVTLLDANHCPGAVMFLVNILGNTMKNGSHTTLKSILHVGDFRWDRTMIQSSPLKDYTNALKLDEIYLDTTYCLEKYRNMPTQTQAINATIDVMESHMKTRTLDGGKCNTLFLFGSYTIGKERIYLSVAQQLGMKVYVDTKKFKILSKIQLPPEQMSLITTKKNEASIWVIPLEHAHFSKIPEYLKLANEAQCNYKIQDTMKIVAPNPYTSAVAFRPTGWTLDERNATNIITSRTMNGVTVHGVPYSEHSSFREIVDCIQCLKPTKIIPTVNLSKSTEQIELIRTFCKLYPFESFLGN